ncbi:MAG: FKBP-type peptidyl-prolyl cis-trans isomerase [Bacteroidetes bacterium]|nr:FKBP-type peptidyl-prolyl cis-trans isomerase [Bacteroidota bacterium]
MNNLKLAFVALATLLMVTACNNETEKGITSNKKVSLTNEIDSVSYALGVNGASSMKSMGITEVNYPAFLNAFQKSMESEEVLIPEAACNQILQTFFQKAQMKQMEEMQASSGDNLKEGQDFLAKNKTEEGIVETASGLQYKVITMGDGAKPKATSQVKVHYHGTLIDGTVFDSSVERGEPIDFALNGVIPGWTEGVQLMPVGSKFKFFIPSEIAYGANPRPGGPIGPNMVLIFDIELIDILD